MPSIFSFLEQKTSACCIGIKKTRCLFWDEKSITSFQSRISYEVHHAYAESEVAVTFTLGEVAILIDISSVGDPAEFWTGFGSDL